jgi:hypothetical protein
MKLNQLSAKPQLIKIVLDDEDTLKEYNEPVEFWTWDRQPMDVFMKLAQATERDMSSIIGIVKDLILDENSQPILTDGAMLPTKILMRAIAKVTQMLGE